MTTVVLLLAFWQPPAPGQTPAIQNARVETRPAAGGLEAAMRTIVAAQSSPAWVGYRVPAVAGRRQTCWDNNSPNYASTVHLEGPTEFYILYRVKENRIEHVRTFSPDCVIDGGNVPFIWLTDVKPSDSVQYLTALAQDTRRSGDAAIWAIAVHAAPEAVQTLLEMARHGRNSSMRSQALMGLAQSAPPQVSEAAIREAIEKDPETQVKRQAVSALGQIPRNEGVPMLLELARSGRNPALQKQAMSALGRSKDERAYKFFEEVLGR